MPKKAPPPQRGAAKPNKRQPPPPAKTSKSKADVKDGTDISNNHDDPAKRKLQQLILDIFRTSLSDTLASPDFQSTLQQVKKALFDRDFEGAFNSEPHLLAYAARWSPTRALCYFSVLETIKPYLDSLLAPKPETQEASGIGEVGDQPVAFKVLAVGGAAAELIAFGAFLGQHLGESSRGEITLVDIGPWAEVVRLLHDGLISPPLVSKYASAAVREAAVAMVRPSERLVSTFKQHDVLALGKDDLTAMLQGPEGSGNRPTPVLVMINFTLNELFTAGGIGRTTTFLLRLSASVPQGSLLLVLDSPGSYSEAAIGGGQSEDGIKEKKKYPMQWLLHKILTTSEDTTWTRLETDDSVWFRLPEGLEYPIPLENMRYQMHLYRADAPTTKAAG